MEAKLNKTVFFHTSTPSMPYFSLFTVQPYALHMKRATIPNDLPTRYPNIPEQQNVSPKSYKNLLHCFNVTDVTQVFLTIPKPLYKFQLNINYCFRIIFLLYNSILLITISSNKNLFYSKYSFSWNYYILHIITETKQVLQQTSDREKLVCYLSSKLLSSKLRHFFLLSTPGTCKPSYVAT